METKKECRREIRKRKVWQLYSNEDIAKQIVELVSSHIHLGTHWTSSSGKWSESHADVFSLDATGRWASVIVLISFR